jgi:hypothetical protein
LETCAATRQLSPISNGIHTHASTPRVVSQPSCFFFYLSSATATPADTTRSAASGSSGSTRTLITSRVCAGGQGEGKGRRTRWSGCC